MRCHNVAEHTEFYLGLLWSNVTCVGNARCFSKRTLQWHSKYFCVQTIVQHHERWIVCTPLSVNVFVTLATQQHNLFLNVVLLEATTLVLYCKMITLSNSTINSLIPQTKLTYLNSFMNTGFGTRFGHSGSSSGDT
jgi:hypothetical protein